ncbi:Hermansky-Pudlak syndrome 1 protein, partial [Tachysurus ichikawai]
MKCLLVATESAEVLFYWTDQAFEQNIKKQYGTSHDDSRRPPAFADSINTLFAPIIISCSTMFDRLGDGYTSFSTENGHIYALHQFEECLYIAVNGDGEETDEDLKRKIFVLKKFTEILFGMVTLSSSLYRKELRPPDTEQRNRVWKKLQRLLETYSRLREQDQSFLVEAVERLIHPTLCEQCIEFLERRLVQQINSSAERAGEEVLHAFILVHTKLLAFFSSRNASTLSSSDLLALITIVQDLYPSNIELDETLSEEVDSTSAPDIFYTPEPSPIERDSGHLSNDGAPVFQFVDPDIQMAEDSLQTLQLPLPDPMTPTRVFLEATYKEGFFPMMPHSMYCLPLWPGITLVLLTKIPNSQVAMSVYVLLEAFAKLEKRLGEGLEGTAALRGQPPIQELRNRVDKFIRMLTSMDILTTQLQNTWAEFKNKAFTRAGHGITKALLPTCRNIRTQLCGVYQQCFAAVCMGANQRLATTLQARAQNMMQEKLTDWKDFLLVKSKRNITMVSYPCFQWHCVAFHEVGYVIKRVNTDCLENKYAFLVFGCIYFNHVLTYLEEFPGLVHFIYVDRTAGQMIAPSLSVTEGSASELGKGPIAHFIKNKLWSLVATTRHCLQKGYTTVTLRDGDFYFCYFLWFENETGYKLEVVDIPNLPDDSAPVGMLAWDYY